MLGNSAVDLAKIAPEIRYKLPDLPQPEPLGAEAERRNLYSAVARYFNTLAAEGPFMLILDDLQWADAATLHLLNFLTLQGMERGRPPAASSPLTPASADPLAPERDATIFEEGQAGRKKNGVPLYVLLYRADEVHETHELRAL